MDKKLRMIICLNTVKMCKKKGHDEIECWIIHPELHRQFNEPVVDKWKEKEVVGTTAASTKVLSSGKVAGKILTNPGKQEWVQRRQSKYQSDKRGHIIDNANGKEMTNVTGKANGNVISTNNVFDALANDGEYHTTQVVHDRQEKEASTKQLNQPKETGKPSPKAMKTRIQFATAVTNPNPKYNGIGEVANKEQTVE